MSEDAAGRGLQRWGWDDRAAALAQTGALVGRVVRVDRGECDVTTGSDQIRVQSSSVRASPDLAPVTGDWVEVARLHGDLVIDRVLPRRTGLHRLGPGRRRQVLAANFDEVGIVAGLDRPLPPGWFERMLVMAGDSGAPALIILTKADLCADAAEHRAAVAAVAGDDVPVVVTGAWAEGPADGEARGGSAVGPSGEARAGSTAIPAGSGLEAIWERLGPGRTMVLVGASGSGKSSLVNALAGTEAAATAPVRPSDARGRHTTIARELILLPGDGGLVIDTPGLRSLSPWDAEKALHRVFADLQRLSASCRFSNCAHGAEPDCAVRAAVSAGDLDPRRFDRYLALRRELADQKPRRR